MLKKTRIIECGKPDTGGSVWCREGLVFRVVNGLGRLCHVCGPDDKDDYYRCQLRLDDVPLVQGYYAVCPTCYGMLATGYGIENVKCEELDGIRETLNQNYTGISTAFSDLSPLLKLLPDGYYMLADVELAPTDGHRFFYNVPNDLSTYSAACDTYYNNELLSCLDSFPAFLFPTQSSASIDEARVDEYRKALQNGAEIRGLAYHEKGFLCALLDGHHKAIAAAQLGIKLKCLVIIPADGHVLQNREVVAIRFSGIHFAYTPKWTEKSEHLKTCLTRLPKYESCKLTDNRFESMDNALRVAYPTVEDLSWMDAVAVTDKEITDELVNQWMETPDASGSINLKYLLEYRSRVDYERAYALAETIIHSRNRQLPHREAWRILLQRRYDHTEELATSYLVEHEPQDDCWDLVTSFWEDSSLNETV